jgi:hypothetical protein
VRVVGCWVLVVLTMRETEEAQVLYKFTVSVTSAKVAVEVGQFQVAA